MPLKDLRRPADEAPLPADVRAFLREADRRIERFRLDCRVPGFVPSDFPQTYTALRGLTCGAARGSLFCEWGSGFGVVACLAAMLDFDACGIEIERELVEAAQQLADDFGLPVEFIQGSFLPAGSKVRQAAGSGFSWLSTEGQSGWRELGLDPADFDVIFAYPWPDEEHFIPKLFERHASAGAVLLTYHDEGFVRLRRKVDGPSRG